MYTIVEIIKTTSELGENKKVIPPNINAINKFVAGPARATSKLPTAGFLKLRGLTGTGFPQPKRKKIKASVPHKSRCFKGLMVRRPAIFAVSSPNIWAAKA